MLYIVDRLSTKDHQKTKHIRVHTHKIKLANYVYLHMCLTVYAAPGFAHFIEPTLMLIVSFIVMYAASVAFQMSLFFHEVKILASSQFGK